MAESEFTFKVVPYVKQEPYNEFTPFVNDHLLTLAADKSIEFAPFPTEDAAKTVLTKVQSAARDTKISVRKRSLTETDKGWVLEIGTAPRTPRAPRTTK